MRSEAKIVPKQGGAAAPPSSSSKNGLLTSVKVKSRLAEKRKKALKATVEEFVDDPGLYFSRLNSKVRLNYWEHIVKIRRRFNKPPADYKSWVKRERDEADKVGKFPHFPVRALQIFVSQTWDYLYLIFFVIFLAVVVIEEENLAASVDSGVREYVWEFMLILMIITQAIPVLGTLLYVHRYNDIIQQLAQKQNFGEWAFTSVLITQYVEHFYYSGQGRSHLAGRWMPLEEPLSPELDAPVSTGFLRLAIEKLKSVLAKPVGPGLSVKNADDGMSVAAEGGAGGRGGSVLAMPSPAAGADPTANDHIDNNANNDRADEDINNNNRVNDDVSSIATATVHQLDKAEEQQPMGSAGAEEASGSVVLASSKPLPLPQPGDRNLHPEVSELTMHDHTSVITRSQSRFPGGFLLGAISGKRKQRDPQNDYQQEGSVRSLDGSLDGGTLISGGKSRTRTTTKKQPMKIFSRLLSLSLSAKVYPNEGGRGRDDEQKDANDSDNDDESYNQNGRAINGSRSSKSRNQRSVGGSGKRFLRSSSLLPGVKEGAGQGENEEEEEEELNSLKSEYDDEMEDNEDWNAEIPGQGKSVLAAVMAQRKAEEEEKRKNELEANAARIAAITEWIDFQCLVCGFENHVPKYVKPKGEVYFDKLGKYYQRTVAVIRVTRDVSRCTKCFSYRDYKPNPCTRHLFPYHPDRYNAFLKYPYKVEVQSNLSTNKFVRFIGWITTCMGGVRDSPDSRLATKDWRLKWFINSQFPDIPRPEKRPEEDYIAGELVECKLQRSDWTLARIISVRRNHTYDIRYDLGDELRLVEEKFLRLPAYKTDDVLYLELGVCFIVISFPVFVLATLQGSAASSAGCPLFVGVLIVAVLLLVLRLFRLCMYFHQYYSAGFLMALRLTALSIFPLFLTIIASAPTIVLYVGYRGMAAVWVLNKIVCLPYIYMIKPGFVLFAAPLFFQTSIGFAILSIYLDNMSIGIPLPLFVPIAPIFTATITLMYYRKIWGRVWNVCSTARPYEEKGALGLKIDANGQFYKFIKDQVNNLRKK